MKIGPSSLDTSEHTLAFSRKIQEMFTAIAPRYDFLNRLLSIGQDRYWRRVAVDRLAPKPNERILDIATGTGDILLEIASRNQPAQIFGLDFSRRMLNVGRIKIKKRGFEQNVSLQIGDGECLPFSDESFDGAVCAFGVRNFSNVKKGLLEFYRILKPGGRVVILEFSMPTNPLFSYFYNFYFNFILPKLGNLFSGHNNAYSYLTRSITDFPDQKKLFSWIKEAGFKNIYFNKLSFGIVTIHSAYKVF